MADNISPSPGSPGVSPWYRLGPVLIAAAVYLVFIANGEFWNLVIWPYSTDKFGLYFVDMQSHLATSQAVAHDQVEVGGIIPDDPMHRIYSGPKWLFWLGYLGLGRAHTLPFTALCLVLFLATVAAFQRPRNLLESGYLLAVLVGPPVMMLVERGNVDLLVFSVLAAAFGLMTCTTAVSRWAGWGLVTAFIGFKYYPAVGYAALLESQATRREKTALLALGLAAVLIFIFLTIAEISLLSSHQIENRHFPFFGSRELFVMAGYSQARAAGLSYAAWLVGVGALAWLLGPLGSAERVVDRRKAFFVGGASIMVFCFISTTSPDYRLTHLLFCLPWLWVLQRDPAFGTAGLRRAASTGLFALIFTPWVGTLGARLAVAVDSSTLWWVALFLKQFGWWILMISLGAILVRILALRGLELLDRPRP